MRPDAINLALIVHVLGAMVLVGGLVTAAVGGAHRLARRGDRAAPVLVQDAALGRVPGVDRDARRRPWVESKEHLDDAAEEPTWLGIGFATAEGGGLLLLIALILGGIGLRRARNGGGNGLLKASGVIATVLVAVYVIAVWAMGGKPT